MKTVASKDNLLYDKLNHSIENQKKNSSDLIRNNSVQKLE